MSSGIQNSDQFDALRQTLIDRTLQDLPNLVAIYAYGSQVQGSARPDSDLDLALLLPHGQRIGAEKLLQLEGDLEAVAGMPVEISVLDPELQLVHCKEVVAYGLPIYVSDASAVAAFAMQTLSSYAQYCEDRQPVTASYVKDQQHG